MRSLGELEVILVRHHWTLKCKGRVVPGEDPGKGVGREPATEGIRFRQDKYHMISLICGI